MKMEVLSLLSLDDENDAGTFDDDNDEEELLLSCVRYDELLLLFLWTIR